ncbi:hypothetical protein CCR85_08650 [Rhodothalassium salexigens]|uniref:Tse2 family ADP-ribosyltransferase toxin n=1 Tax=Rhodothalassium salexigens TaxID=1086 RepID=UPI00191319B9|nr:hypothetical protein [Rhodothalassium salexigens]MBK5911555.1 hypothetical protein [Rhodothalassium salexigens]
MTRNDLATTRARQQRLSLAALCLAAVGLWLAGTLAGTAQTLYRGMVSDGGNPAQPRANPTPQGNQNLKNYLNVVTDGNYPDVQVHNGNVNPQNDNHRYQGMSVSPVTGCNLPAHRRPQGAWGGTSNVGNFRVWRINNNQLPNTLTYHADAGQNPTHGVVSPAQQMTVAAYRQALAGTANNWVLAQPPQGGC